MKVKVCDICGSKNISLHNGVYKCEDCGMWYYSNKENDDVDEHFFGDNRKEPSVTQNYPARKTLDDTESVCHSERPPIPPTLIIKRKRSVWPAIIIVTAIVLLAVGAFIYKTRQAGNDSSTAYGTSSAAKKLDYKADARTFCNLVLNSSAKLEDIGNDIMHEWAGYVKSTYKTKTLEATIYDTLDMWSSTISDIEETDSKIDSLYRELMNCRDTSDYTLLSIRDSFSDLYVAYKELYYTVLTPSGSYMTWKNSFYNADNSCAIAYDCLKALL